MALSLRAAGGCFLGLVAGCAAAASAAADVKPLDGGATLFVDVNVVSMAAPGVQAGRSVLVRDGRIEAIGAKGDVDGGEGVRVVDGGGTAYLMPGLVDMHLHVPPQPGEKGDPTWRTMILLVANGVTTARGLAGHPGHIAVRERVHRGDLLGPTLYVAGPVLHIGAVKTPEAAAAKVKEQAEAGFDLIKAHHIPVPELYDALQASAKEAGVPVAGHVTNEVGLTRALAAGQQVEHLDGYVAELAVGMPKGVQYGQFPPVFALAGIADDRVEALAARVVEAGVWNTPTLALFERITDVATPTEDFKRLPEMRYISPQAIEAWSGQRAGLMKSGHFDEDYRLHFAGLRGRIVVALHKAGARLMAGSDCPQAFLVPGFALHDELGALERAGLTAWAALETGTVNPARYLKALPREGSATGVKADFGTIEVGKRADLVLVEADPTVSVENARKINGVMVRGKWLDRKELDRMLEEVAASVAGQGEGGGAPAGVALRTGIRGRTGPSR